MRRARAVLPLALLLLCAAPMPQLLAQQPPIVDNRRFQSGIEVTSVTATVTDRDGHLVTGLERDAFEVFEDGMRQTVTQFTRERVPVGLGVLLDNSDSMFGQRIDDARAAVDRFLFELLDPADEFFLMAFNHRPRPLTGWTRAQPDVRRALDGLRPNGGTAIYDAIVDALPLLEVRTRPRGALVVISDGADTASDIYAARAAIVAAAHRRLRLRHRDRSAGPPGDQHPGQRAGAPRDHRRDRRAHRDRPELGAADRGHRADRRGVEQPVRARLHVAARRRRPVPQHPRAGRRRRLPGPGAQRLCRHAARASEVRLLTAAN